MAITSQRYTARDDRAAGPGVLGTKVFLVTHYRNKWGTGRTREFVCDAGTLYWARKIARALNAALSQKYATLLKRKARLERRAAILSKQAKAAH